MRTTFSALACAIVCASWCAGQAHVTSAATGVISGTVRGNDGSTITSGLVTASGVRDAVKSRPERTSRHLQRLGPTAPSLFPLSQPADIGSVWRRPLVRGLTPASGDLAGLPPL
jgi:hypothetical protein